MSIVKIRSDKGVLSSEEIVSLRDAVNTRRTATFFMTKIPVSGYLYPGSYGNIDKVVVSVTSDMAVSLDIVTKVDPLMAVIDPKRVTAEAIQYLKNHHEEEVKRQFLHQVFFEDCMVLPSTEIVVARTEDNRDYVLCSGSIWEISANDQLIPVYSVPSKKIVDIAMGDRASDKSRYTYVTHAVYTEDISFE